MADTQSTAASPLVADVDALAANDEREYFLEFLEISDAAREPHLATMDEIWENWLVALPGSTERHFLWPRSTGNVPSSFVSGQTRLKDPETHQIIQSMTAQALTLMFAPQEYISTKPVGAGQDYEKARASGMVITGFLERPGEFLTDYITLTTAFIFGTAYQEIGWETRARLQYALVPIIDDMGVQHGRRIVPKEVIYKDQPLRRVIDNYDAYPDPGGTRIHTDMRGFGKRFEIYEEEARALAQSPGEGIPPVYDPAAVERAIRAGRYTGGSDPVGTSSRMNDYTKNRSEGSRYMNKMTGFEYHGFSPVRRRDGFSQRTLTMLNGVMVRSSGMPYISGQIPIKEFTPMPVPGRHWGLSPAAVIRFLQDAADANLMLITDMLTNAMYGPLMVSPGFGGDREALRNRHVRQLIEVLDPTKVAQVPTDYNAMRFGIDWYGRQKQVMRESSGRTDPVQAIPTSGDKTATEVGELVRLASQRIETMIQLIERNDYPWIGRTLHERFRQFMGDAEVWMRFAGEPFQFTFDDIDTDVDVRFVGSRYAMSRFQKIAGLRDAINTIATGLPILPLMPDLFIRLLRDGLEVGDAEAIVSRAIMAAAALGHMQPGGPAGPPAPNGRAQTGGGGPPEETPNAAPPQTETGAAEREGRPLA